MCLYPDTWDCSYVTRPAATHTWCPLGRSRCPVSREFGGKAWPLRPGVAGKVLLRLDPVEGPAGMYQWVVLGSLDVPGSSVCP